MEGETVRAAWELRQLGFIFGGKALTGKINDSKTLAAGPLRLARVRR
jgi:hypothetical protein